MSCIPRTIFAIGLFLIAPPAVADIIQIPAITFTQRASSVLPGVAQGGTLTNANGKYYAAVPFPADSDGNSVCSFTLIHRDGDADSEINARLFKKRIVLGSNPFTVGLVQMARVHTGVMAGTSGVAAKTDTTIASSTLTLDSAFYYVELDVGSTLLEVLGVQINYSQVC